MNIHEDINDIIEAKDENKILSTDIKNKMRRAIIYFIYKSIEKFIKGQEEHGGNLTERNLDEEVYNELIDLYWYNEANKWK